MIGGIPLATRTEEDIAIWVQVLEEKGAAPETIANKHGFRSGALAAAVPKHLPANVAAGRRLPRGDGDDHEILCLTRAQFAHLRESVTEPWQPMVEFLVASGARIGEVLALKPGDVDIAGSEVRIRRRGSDPAARFGSGGPGSGQRTATPSGR